MYFYYSGVQREGLEFIRLTLREANFDHADDRSAAVALIEEIGEKIAEQVLERYAKPTSHIGLFRSRAQLRGFRVNTKIDTRKNYGKLSWYVGNRRVWVERIQVLDLLDLESGSVIANARLLGGFAGMLLVGSIVEPAIQQSKTGAALISAGAHVFDEMAEIASDVAAAVLRERGVEGQSHRDGSTLKIVAILPRRREDLERPQRRIWVA
jgi:hypothetical protein